MSGSSLRPRPFDAAVEMASTFEHPSAIAGGTVDPDIAARVASSVQRFVQWLDRYGETSYDFQTFYAGAYGRFAKALYYRQPRLGVGAVAPIIFCEAFAPWTRRFYYERQRFPIADAHYAMGFAQLFRSTGDRRHLQRAIHFLETLERTACRGDSGMGWGYPFDWVVIDRTIHAGTPLITTLPYVYEAFAAVYEIDGQRRWLDVMRSIAEHALRDYRDYDRGNGAAACTYTPMANDPGGVVNASAYRAFLLTRAAHELGQPEYQRAVEPNLRFVLSSQNADGSWYYAMDGRRTFIDHFHTCFVLKSLVKIDELTGRGDCQHAIEAGLAYYAQHLFDADGLPRPFAKPPRITVYRRELYDYAECINLLSMVGNRFAALRPIMARAVEDVLTRWQNTDGSFRSRQLLLGWDNVPMHRWAQAQLFRSLCGLLGSSSKGAA
jgi:hypothetical protein